tara:strand:- start:1737 stop:2117 length:381 start_codon:yes stop_codon:yes gene_type:complete
MSFIGRSGYVPRCAFSKKLIINGTSSKDIFASLYCILKQIVFHELSNNGNLDLSEIQENDILMLKQRFLEYGIDLFIERHEGNFVPKEKNPNSKLSDQLIILAFQHRYTKIFFDYALLSFEPRHLE